MKILIIPDVHLKPWMFTRASELMKSEQIGQAVCLMDIADDWNQQLNIDLYIQTYDAAIAFASEYPDTRWCLGNHDICYLWDKRESGYSPYAVQTVCEKIRILQNSLPDENHIAFVHRIDNVLFSHAGLTDEFVRRFVPAGKYNDIDSVIDIINRFSSDRIWTDDSPIWARPQYASRRMYKPRKLMQIVGHTPTTQIEKRNSLLSCDVFSTYSSGEAIGTREYVIVDSVTKDYSVIR